MRSQNEFGCLHMEIVLGTERVREWVDWSKTVGEVCGQSETSLHNQ